MSHKTTREVWMKYKKYANKKTMSLSGHCGFLDTEWCKECSKNIPYTFEVWYKSWGWRVN